MSKWPRSQRSEQEIEALYNNYGAVFSASPIFEGFPRAMHETEAFYQLLEQAIETGDRSALYEYFDAPADIDI